MEVEIVVEERLNDEPYSLDKYVVFDKYFGLTSSSDDKSRSLNFVKGAVLAAICNWENVPDKIEFKITTVAVD